MALPLSVLDLAPVASGSSGPQALRNSLDLARTVDALGYTRYWMAEHHNSSRIVSSAPEILIALVAHETRRIRVGSGGIMLPNHSPLKVAETFRTLEGLYPGRIDLGIGRAPGTDQLTALALRRDMDRLNAEDFPEQLQELQAYCGEAAFPEGAPFHKVKAAPVDVRLPPIWLLGSSGFGARLAAAQGRGFAFAFHFSPEQALPAMRAYREQFRPSAHLDKPHAILAVSVICSDTEERAEELARTFDAMWLGIIKGRDEPLLSPEEVRDQPWTPADLQQARAARAMLVWGTPSRVRERLEALAAEMGADELMVTTNIHSHTERLHSFALLADAFGLPRAPSAS